MNDFVDSFAYWLADYYLATTVLFAAAIAALALMKQPAKRMAIVKATLLAAVLLTALCAIPGWSLVHLASTAPESPRATVSAPISSAVPTPFEPTDLQGLSAPFPADIVTVPSVGRAPTWAPSWLSIALAAYALGSAATLLRLALGMAFARRILREAVLAPAEVDEVLTTVLAGERSRPRLRVSRQIDVAAALGIFRPTVLLPSSWMMERSPTELRTILAHECAHVRNGDLKWLAISRLASVVLWLQPLYWLIRRRMRLDQETLADATAAEFSNRVTYAEQLVAWARAVPFRPRPALASAVGLWESPSQLRRRVALLLDEHFPVLRECSRRLRWASLLVCGLMALALSAVTFQPTMSEPNGATGDETWSMEASPIVIGNKFIVCPVRTDVQRALLGYVSEPDQDTSVFVLANADGAANEELGGESPAMVALSDKLAEFARHDNGLVRFQVHVGVSRDQSSFDQGKKRAESLAKHCEALGRAAGFERTRSTTSFVSRVDWPRLVDLANRVTTPEELVDETSVDDGQVRAYTIWTPLSRLQYDFDCVMDVRSPIRPESGAAFSDDLVDSMKESVLSLNLAGRGRLMIRVIHVKSAEEQVRTLLSSDASRRDLASKLGFAYCEVESSLTEDVPPPVSNGDKAEAQHSSVGGGAVKEEEIVGIVLDERGEPLASVLVDAWTWFPGNETTTDVDGRFTLKGLDARERVELQFTKAGFCPRLFLAEPVGKPNWVVTLNSRTYLEGRVLDPEGRPVAGINLRATRGPFETPDGSRIGAVWTETETDSDGRYRIYLEPDTYELRVRRPEVGVARYEKVVVRENDRRDFDLQLESGPTFRARVVDSETGAPVGGIRLFRWREPGIAGSSNEKGELSIENMLPGRYEFNVSADSEQDRFPHVAGEYTRWWSPEALNAWQRLELTNGDGSGFQRNFDGLEFDIRAGMEPVTIVVERGVRIGGQVLDPDGKPVAGATIAPAKTGSGNSLTGDTRYSVKTGADARFETRLPASGAAKYNLVAHDGDYELWRTWANGVGELLATKPGDRLENVTLKLTRPSVVRGRVLDALGKPLANHPVRAHAADKKENRYYDPTTKTNEQGEFTLEFVRPGKHYIQADPFWLTAEDGPTGGWRLVEASPDRAVEGIELRVGDDPQATGTLNVTLQELREKADQVRAASDDAENGESAAKAQTQDTTVTIASGSLSFVATKNPVTPWDYKPNVLAFAIQDETGTPVEGVEAVVYRVSLDTGDRSEVGRAATDARGEVEFAEPVEPKWAETLQEMVAQSQLLPELRTIFCTVLRRDGMATVLLPASDYSIATTGIKRTVRMRPAAELSGRVTDRNGKPVAGALVAAGNLAGSVAMEGVNAVRTDSEGRYRLSNVVAFNRAAGDQRRSERNSFVTAAQIDMSKMYPAVYDPAEETSVSDLTVSHPDFAVTTVRGGDVPGSTEVVMQPNSMIAGRVVEFDTGKPVMGMRIKTVGKISDAAGNESLHIVSTFSDAVGEYRLNNLPAGNYEVWAEEAGDVVSKQGRISRGLVDVAASAEKSPVRVPDLVLGSGGTIRGRLIDAATGKPLEPGDLKMTVKVVTQLIDPFGNQGSPVRQAAVGRDGRFSVQAIPGKSRVFLIVNSNEPGSDPQGDYRSADDEFEIGPVFDLKHGESVDAEFEVWSRVKIEEERAKQRSAAVAPAKKVEKPNLLRDIRLAAAPILAEMAAKHGYDLAEGQDLRRVAPPFPPIRMKYYQVGHPTQAKYIATGPSGIVFRWANGRLTNWGMTFGPMADGGYSLDGVLDALLGIKKQGVDGPHDLREQRLPGDWIVRTGVSDEEIVSQLQAIMQNELSLPIKLEFREVPRDVYVARGDYKLTPLPGYSGREEMHYENRTVVYDEIEIFGKQLVPNTGAGGGTGSYSEFLRWLGEWVGATIVSEAKGAPGGDISWNLHERSPFTEQMQAEDRDPKLVLANITAQTGLTFTKETRRVRVLVVEESN